LPLVQFIFLKGQELRTVARFSEPAKPSLKLRTGTRSYILSTDCEQSFDRSIPPSGISQGRAKPYLFFLFLLAANAARQNKHGCAV
jgi:hypothetical protein